MKKALLLGLLAFVPGAAHAFNLQDFYKDVIDNTKLSVLQNASPAFFYDASAGSDKSGQAGAVTHAVTYKFLYLDLGWKTPFIASQTGTGVAGLSLSADKLVAEILPNYTTWVNSFIPASAMPFWKAAYLGPDAGWNFDNGAFYYGYHAGVELKF